MFGSIYVDLLSSAHSQFCNIYSVSGLNAKILGINAYRTPIYGIYNTVYPVFIV